MASTLVTDVAAWAQSGATIVLAGAASLIAYRQWRTAQQKLVLDLFDKRFAVYMAMEAYFNLKLAKEPVPEDKVAPLVDAVRSVDFLFGDDVTTFSNDVIRAGSSHKLAELDALKERAPGVFLPYLDLRARRL